MSTNSQRRSVLTPDGENYFSYHEPRRWVRKLVLYGPLAAIVIVWAVWKIGLLRWLEPLTNYFPHLIKLKTECGDTENCISAVTDVAILNIAELICFAILMLARHFYFRKVIAHMRGNLYPWKYVGLIALLVIPTWMFLGVLDKAPGGSMPSVSPFSVVMWYFVAAIVAFGQPGVEVRRYYRSLSSS